MSSFPNISVLPTGEVISSDLTLRPSAEFNAFVAAHPIVVDIVNLAISLGVVLIDPSTYKVHYFKSATAKVEVLVVTITSPHKSEEVLSFLRVIYANLEKKFPGQDTLILIDHQEQPGLLKAPNVDQKQ